jgi:type IV secretory pathway TrbD component
MHGQDTSIISTLVILGIPLLIVIIGCIVWNLAHSAGYAKGHNDASLDRVTTRRQ